MSRDELIKSQSGEFKKNLRPIDEVDEYIDPRIMDKVKAVSFNNPVKEDSEYDKSEKYSEMKSDEK